MIKANLIFITAVNEYDFFHMQFPSTIYFIEIIFSSYFLIAIHCDDQS